MTIDQQTRRRMARTGLTALRPGTSLPRLHAVRPDVRDRRGLPAVDINGEVAHQWQMPYPPGLYGYLLPNGNLFLRRQGAR